MSRKVAARPWCCNISASSIRLVTLKKSRLDCFKRDFYLLISVIETVQYPLDIESIQIHHLSPGGDKVFNKLFFGVTAGVNLGGST